MKGLLFFLLFFPVCLFSQHDTSRFRTIGFESGVVSYSSIDEIYNPYIYSGRNLNYSLFTKRNKSKSFSIIKLDFSLINRTLENVQIPDYYYIVAYDSHKTFKIESEQSFQKNTTSLYAFQFQYFRKLNLHLFKNDLLSLGFENQNTFVLRNYIDDPELISFTLSPAFYYSFIFEKHTFSMNFSIGLLGLNLRKSYSGTGAQVEDKFQGYFNYFRQNSKFNLINNYLCTSARLQYEYKLSRKIGWNFFYDFNYLHLKVPRNLTSLYSCFGMAFTYKFGNYGKN